MVFDYLLMELGKHLFWTAAFQCMGTERFVEPNHIIRRFGFYYWKKHGLKHLKAMTTLSQDLMKKV